MHTSSPPGNESRFFMYFGSCILSSSSSLRDVSHNGQLERAINNAVLAITANQGVPLARRCWQDVGKLVLAVTGLESPES